MMSVSVRTNNGVIKGTTSNDYDNKPFYCFYGVPYAEPPIGELRFKAPQPLGKWSDVKDCTKVKEGCISRHIFTLKFTGSEDCLFLNIYTKRLPTMSKEDLKPAFVWIHGGGFLAGSPNTDLYGPDFLITQDIVIVTVAYRLGPLGFLCIEDESLEVPGNAGVKDILMALKWVNENIQNFNGDPSNITLAGQSSAAAIVQCLMMTPLAKGLFHKAILQSGSAIHEFFIGRRDAAWELAEKLGFKSNDQYELLKFLRNVPAIDLIKASEKMRILSEDVYINCIKPFLLVIEKPSPGAVMTQLPISAVLSGNYHKIPILMGYTNQEGLYTLFIIRKLKIIIDDFENMVPYTLKLERGSQLSKSIANKIQEFYFNNEIATADNKFKYIEMMSAVYLKYPVYRAAKHFIKNLNLPIYFYQFSVDTKLNLYKTVKRGDMKGACHSDDLCYLFKTMLTPEIKPGSIEDVSIRRMTKLWGNFIRTGNPNPQNHDPLIEIDWKPIQPDVLHYVDIRNDGLVTGQNPDKEDMSFWDDIYQLDPAYLKQKL